MPNTRRIGFVSLGCAKALVDSERILTQLRVEGYDIVPSYEDADLIVVNTRGFINDAVAESLDTISEALERNGKVIVTGCLGIKADKTRERHPQGPRRHRTGAIPGHSGGRAYPSAAEAQRAACNCARDRPQGVYKKREWTKTG